MRTARRSVAAAVTAAVLVATAGCTADTATPRASAPPSQAPTASTGTPAPAEDGWWRASDQVATLASGLVAPWSVVPLPTGGALISQRDDGRIMELTADGDLRTAGTVEGVVSGGESGLHGLALSPADGDEPVLYAYFGSADDNRIVRMPLAGRPGALSLGAQEVVFSGIPRANTHDGGRLAFGPDGLLYVTTGDAQQRDQAQDPDALGGKILRLTPDGEPAPGNPWGNAAWSMGHRNVQGITWTSDGVMWASEFGQDTWDELNRIDPGHNYGWPVVEGVADDPSFTDPVAAWATSEASPSGIAARGRTVFIAGLRGERLWIVDTRAGEASGEPVAAFEGAHGRLRDAVLAPDGSLWVLTNNTDGRGSPGPEDDLLLRVALTPAS